MISNIAWAELLRRVDELEKRVEALEDHTNQLENRTFPLQLIGGPRLP